MTFSNRILLADHEEVFLNMTASLLRREGYLCECALDANIVAKFLRENSYDLFIANIEIASTYKPDLVKDFSFSKAGTPAIITSYPGNDLDVRSLRLPVVTCLIKPFDFHDLLRETRQALTCTAKAGEGKAHVMPDSRFHQLVASEDAQLVPEIVAPLPPSEQLGNLMRDLQQNLTSCFGTLMQLLKTLDTLELRNEPLLNVSVLPYSSVSASPPGNQKESIKESAVREQEAKSQAIMSMLSLREREILSRLCSNQRVPMIARDLYISPHTVRNHLKSIFRKLDVKSQIELLTLLGQDRLNNLH